MNDPKRLRELSDPFERELLEAGRADGISTQRKRALISSLGVAVPLAPSSELRSSVEVTAKPDFPPPTPELYALPSVASSGSGILGGKALLATLGAGGAAALAVWAAVATQEAPSSDATPRAPIHFEVEPAPSDPEPEAVTPDPTPVEVAPEAEEVAPEAEEASPIPARRSSAHDKSDGLAAELALIDGARSALARGDATASLRQLDDYARQYPKGRLRSEATVLRIQALSASGNRSAAERLGKAELNRSPNGPYARKIRSLIAGTSGGP